MTEHATRKRTYYGVPLGILMLDSKFERFNGDIGNAQTWPFPVQYKIVRGAVPNKVVDTLNNRDLFQLFLDHGDEHEHLGHDSEERGTGPEGEEHPQRAAERGEQEALGQQLADQPRPPGAEGEADGDLLAPAEGAFIMLNCGIRLPAHKQNPRQSRVRDIALRRNRQRVTPECFTVVPMPGLFPG